MPKHLQRALHCPCGRSPVIARGLCGTCYTLRRQGDEHFGGLREQVLARDGHRCRVCGASGAGKRTLAVHHRVPGTSTMALMLTLCLRHHAMMHRTRAVLKPMPELLLTFWREQHPDGHEQKSLDFVDPPAEAQELPC